MHTLSASPASRAVRPPGVTFRLASDERLARWAADGRDGAMAAIFERHHQALHRYCHSILANESDAADALQNTMIKALRSLPGETRRIALKPWLYRIAHNESISMLRARRPEDDLDSAIHVSDTAASGRVESRERLRELTGDLGELTERQRGALLMRELGGLEFEDVAAVLSTTPSAVKQCVYEARRALQSMQEGRAMDCEVIRRTISDGDKRMLRGMRMRGHLRSCAGCRDFEAALHRRPEQLGALIPPLPVAAAAAMLHSILGGAGAGGGSGGGGLLAGLVGSAKATTTLSLGSKAVAVVAVVAVGATLTGGAVYVAPERGKASPERPEASSQRALDAGTVAAQRAAVSPVNAARRARSSATATSTPGLVKTTTVPGAAARSGIPGGMPAGIPRGKPAGTPGRRPSSTPAGKPAGTPGTPGTKPSSTPGAKPAGTPSAKPVSPSAGAPSAKPTVAPPGAKPDTMPVTVSPGAAMPALPATTGDRGPGRRAAVPAVAPDGP